jgi:hypothetical protein
MHNGKQPSQGKACGRQWVECSAQYLMVVGQCAVIARLRLERIALRGMCRAVGVGLEG